MNKLPNELVCMIGENLSRRDLSMLNRVCRAYRELLEPLLYRLHAIPRDSNARTAVNGAVGIADPNIPETQTTALTVLGKVEHFCRLDFTILEHCRHTPRIPGWIGSDIAGQVGISQQAWIHLIRYPSLSPLHVAVLKGMDNIVTWLIERGVSIDLPVPESDITALYLAALENRVSTALLLLANHANPTLVLDRPNSQEPPTIVHLACALGHAELTERLLASQHVRACPTELLAFHRLKCRSDTPELVAALVRHGAEVSDDLVLAFLRASKWLSVLELFASPAYRNRLTARRANGLLQAVLSSRDSRLAEHTESIVRVLHHLLDRGADPNLGRLLWPQSAGLSYPTMLKLLPPLLKAGMDVRPVPKRRRGARQQQLLAEHGVDDLLGDTSPYNESLYEEGADAQLTIVRLLLKHGAPIGGATREDALDSYSDKPDGRDGRACWSYKLCHVLLDHCNSTPEDRRGGDIDIFLRRFSEKQKRKGDYVLLDGL